jgi:hypothetical protein
MPNLGIPKFTVFDVRLETCDMRREINQRPIEPKNSVFSVPFFRGG